MKDRRFHSEYPNEGGALGAAGTLQHSNAKKAFRLPIDCYDTGSCGLAGRVFVRVCALFFRAYVRGPVLPTFMCTSLVGIPELEPLRGVSKVPG